MPVELAVQAEKVLMDIPVLAAREEMLAAAVTAAVQRVARAVRHMQVVSLDTTTPEDW